MLPYFTGVINTQPMSKAIIMLLEAASILYELKTAISAGTFLKLFHNFAHRNGLKAYLYVSLFDEGWPLPTEEST